MPIGSLTDKPNESYLGAFYHTIKVLKQKNASSKILTLTPTYQVPVKGNKVRRTDETRNKLGHNLHDYVRAQIQASYVLDIPVVNLMQKHYLILQITSFVSYTCQMGCTLTSAVIVLLLKNLLWHTITISFYLRIKKVTNT